MWSGKKPELPKPAASSPKEKDFEPIAAPSAPLRMEEIAMSSFDVVRPTVTAARLGPNLHVKGEISGDEDLQIDGTIEGLVQLEDQKLTIGSSAKVTADIIAREVVIYGKVKGNLRASDRIEVKKDGSVVGDLSTARIMVEEGAYFKGSIEIERAPANGEAHVEPSHETSAYATVKKARTPDEDGRTVTSN